MRHFLQRMVPTNNVIYTNNASNSALYKKWYRPIMSAHFNPYQWTATAAQDEWDWRGTAEQGAERFMAKWIAVEKARAGLRHAVIPNMPECDGKNQGEDSPKQAGSCWFARHS